MRTVDSKTELKLTEPFLTVKGLRTNNSAKDQILVVVIIYFFLCIYFQFLEKIQERMPTEINERGATFLLGLIEDIRSIRSFEDYIKFFVKKYGLGKYRITSMSVQNISNLYKRISQKFYSPQRHEKKTIWFENELKLFIWVLACYCRVQGRELDQLSHEDYSFLSIIFNDRPPEILEFQVKHFTSVELGKKWDPEETELLQVIINNIFGEQNDAFLSWRTISLNFFTQSRKKYFRTAVQCKEHWVNYLNPNRMRRQPWSNQEDIVLFAYVKHFGKSWSNIARILNGRRTCHDAKNRFRTLCNTRRKASRSQLRQSRVISKQLVVLKKKCKGFEEIQKAIQSQGSDSSYRFENMSLKSENRDDFSMCAQVSYIEYQSQAISLPVHNEMWNSVMQEPILQG